MRVVMELAGYLRFRRLISEAEYARIEELIYGPLHTEEEADRRWDVAPDDLCDDHAMVAQETPADIAEARALAAERDLEARDRRRQQQRDPTRRPRRAVQRNASTQGVRG